MLQCRTIFLSPSTATVYPKNIVREVIVASNLMLYLCKSMVRTWFEVTVTLNRVKSEDLNLRNLLLRHLCTYAGEGHDVHILLVFVFELGNET
jgi:hypothetical protein